MSRGKVVSRSIGELSFHELALFAELARIRSVRELSRRRKVAAGQVSKSLTRLEEKVGHRLLERSVSGVALTRQGHELLERILRILPQVDELETWSRTGESSPLRQVVGIGSSAFLNNYFIAPGIARVCRENPEYGFRILEVAPDQLIVAGLRGAFELCLHVDALDWPQSWESRLIGHLRWCLIGRKEHPLGMVATPSEVAQYPFIVPVYWTPEGTLVGQDQCPLPATKRTKGHETATADAAVAIVQETDQLAFVPELVVRRRIAAGALTEISVPNWKTVTRPLYVTARAQSVSNRLFERIIADFKRSLR